MLKSEVKVLDCTMRDGGYYNSWDFPKSVVEKYIIAMSSAGVDIIEIGLRSLKNSSFKGAYAYCTDDFLSSITLPESVKLGVMINGAEIVGVSDQEAVLKKLFPNNASDSPVGLVRIACHVHEFLEALPACNWLKEQGYLVGFNLMQVAEREKDEVEALALAASRYDIDALYFADSMGSMNPQKTAEIVSWFRAHWKGEMGIHTHDNMGLALSNTLTAIENGITWVDATVTGMGRGPGNARTEEVAIEVADLRKTEVNLVPLMELIRTYFQPLKNECGWGSNPYYYLSGKYGIHPTYIQEMLSDKRFSEEDVLAAIEHLRVEGGKKFSVNSLNATRDFYRSGGKGAWKPSGLISGKPVLIVGAGASVQAHREALELFIKKQSPVVIALNTQSTITESLIDLRVASHPVRLLADCDIHSKLSQPLVTPLSQLPEDIVASIGNKEVFDFGINIQSDCFEVGETSAVIPNSLVISYALALASSGGATEIFLAGFDGFGAGDNRTHEMQRIFSLFKNSVKTDVTSITNTEYDIPSKSVYGL
ncbi:hypothetical protein KUL156_46750 [Alteromonas sp. KUL156]|nr:hypothetical protein KUL154_32150 [Alteromonas sp. KUL154]GFE02083.1 hypothetical protein KUL156_46750 [Alteromonas sp. KUL156]